MVVIVTIKVIIIINAFPSTVPQCAPVQGVLHVVSFNLLYGEDKFSRCCWCSIQFSDPTPEVTYGYSRHFSCLLPAFYLKPPCFSVFLPEGFSSFCVVAHSAYVKGSSEGKGS